MSTNNLPSVWENPYAPLPHEPLIAAVAAFIGVPVKIIRDNIALHGDMALTAPVDRAIRAFVVTHNRAIAQRKSQNERDEPNREATHLDQSRPDDGGEPTDLRECGPDEAERGGGERSILSTRTLAERLSRSLQDRH